MYRLIVFLIVFAVSAGVVRAAEDDYFVGLNAYKDGLSVVAELSLEEYVRTGEDKDKLNYANYLLYKINMAEGRETQALKYYKKIQGVNDERFDRETLTADGIRLYAEDNCDRALSFVRQSPTELTLSVYSKTDCPVDTDTAKIFAEYAGDKNTLLRAAVKAESVEAAGLLFDKIPLSKLSDRQKKYFALRFYKDGDVDRFWKIYKVYKDKDIVQTALSRLNKIGETDTYLRVFESYRDEFALSRQPYCQAIELYRDKEKKFDCEIIDKCLTGKGAGYVSLKTACYIKNGDADNLTKFVDALSFKSFENVCSYADIIFRARLYKGVKQFKFYECADKYKIGKTLMNQGKPKAVANLFQTPVNDTDYYYLALATAGLGNREKAREIARNIENGKIKSKALGKIQ